MSLWEAVVRAGVTTLAVMVSISVYERKILWFPIIPGIVSVFVGYLTDNSIIGALVFLVVYVVLALRHPMRTRELERDEKLLEYRHRLR